MLTRGLVARRLGKSIATVRRMEGLTLHPVRDEAGILRFDANEVEQVAQGKRPTFAFDRSDAGSKPRDSFEPQHTVKAAHRYDHDKFVQRLNSELTTILEQHRDVRVDLTRELARQASHETEARELLLLIDEVVSFATSLTPRERRHLTPQLDDLFDQLEHALSVLR